MDTETKLFRDAAKAALDHEEAMFVFEHVDREDFPMVEKAFRDMKEKRYELASKLLLVRDLL